MTSTRAAASLHLDLVYVEIVSALKVELMPITVFTAINVFVSQVYLIK